MGLTFLNVKSALRICALVIMMFFIKPVVLLDSVDSSQRDGILTRQRRQLLYPNSTLFQFNAGIATPVIVDNHTLSVNWLFQANFQLPWNRTQIPTDILLAGPGYTAQAREHLDPNSQTDKEVEEEEDESYENPEYSGNSKSRSERVDVKRDVTTETKIKDNTKDYVGSKIKEEIRYNDEVRPHHAYKFAEDFLSGLGHNGSGCVLRAICQLGAEPLHSDDDEDLLFEISQYLLSPLYDSGSFADEEIQPYAEAHNYGLHNGDCQVLYPDCRIPLVDIFTSTYQ